MKKFILLMLLALSVLHPLSAQKRRPAARQAAPAPVPAYSAAGKTAVVYTTAKNTQYRMSNTASPVFASFGQPVETQPCVFIDPEHSYQTMLGIGGAITDASAETFSKLPPEKQNEVLKAYFNPADGIGYTLARTNIHSCDFSSGSYTYVTDGDTQLRSFSVAHDETHRIPLIRKAKAEAGGKLTLYASPWSPPAWMKTNGDMLHGGKLKPEFRQTWADYFVKFIQEYEKHGLPVWGISVQNEPMATQTWESCIWTDEEERDFVRDFLGPTLTKNKLAGKKIIIWDHNRDLMYQRASTVLNDKEAAKYVWGVGFHWYAPDNFDNVKRVKESFPTKNLLFTEGCNYPFNFDSLNLWHWGENYGRNMIHDFNNGAVGWTDWNILLDETGGPNHVGNFCLAPIHADTRNGKLHYMNSFYYLGHFSKYIRPGAKRISCSSNRDQLLATAFRNTDGRIAVVVMNTGNTAVPFQLWVKGQAAPVESLPHSIMTILF